MVEGTFQPPVSYGLGVEQLQGAGSRIPRVGERLILVPFPFRVQAVKGLVRHIYLPPYLEFVRISAAVQLLRDIADVPDIFRHIVAYGAVSSCQCPEKLPVSVCEAYRRAVELQFAGIAEALADGLGNTLCKCLHFADVVCVPEGEHRIFVGVLFEFLVPGSVCLYSIFSGVCRK